MQSSGQMLFEFPCSANCSPIWTAAEPVSFAIWGLNSWGDLWQSNMGATCMPFVISLHFAEAWWLTSFGHYVSALNQPWLEKRSGRWSLECLNRFDLRKRQLEAALNAIHHWGLKAPTQHCVPTLMGATCMPFVISLHFAEAWWLTSFGHYVSALNQPWLEKRSGRWSWKW